MRAVDTNVLLRFLLGDDPEQSPRAIAILTEHAFIPLTVLLETGWVLASRYGRSRAEIAGGLRTLLEVETVQMQSETAVRWALDRFEQGADLADMIHLIASGEAGSFATFDRRLARSAGQDAPIFVETL